MRASRTAQVRRARAIGVRAVNRAAVDSLATAGLLVPLLGRTRHWIVRGRRPRTLLVPAMVAALEEIGEQFEAQLTELGLPLYRFEITSALRTAEQQADLRLTNSNAAAGVSSHEFGTTVDISYAAFAPPAELPDELFEGVPPELKPQMERLANLALESVSARKSRELGAIFSDVLTEAQRDGLVIVIYERQQTIYHVTVARPTPPPDSPTERPSSP